jgi:hypothetical protein
MTSLRASYLWSNEMAVKNFMHTIYEEVSECSTEDVYLGIQAVRTFKMELEGSSSRFFKALLEMGLKPESASIIVSRILEIHTYHREEKDNPDGS